MVSIDRKIVEVGGGLFRFGFCEMFRDLLLKYTKNKPNPG